MRYQHVIQAEFIERINRFTAYVRIGGNQEKVHVKNTGRCRELLVRGAKVYLDQCDKPGRSTAYDLVTVEKNGRMVNIDSQAPNKAVGEWLKEGSFFDSPVLVRPETVYGKSRFDFYVETERDRIFLEVKGVTLEEDGVVRFPDAPSERAVKHVEELIRAGQEGYRVIIVFVVQMKGVKYFMPNADTHRAFAEALVRARKTGVEIFAFDCRVTSESMEIGDEIPVFLTKEESMQYSYGNLKKTFRLGDLFAIPKPLLKWYDKSRRILPWREIKSPYRVWVSEIMLQQTRVEAVKPYFGRFMEKLPDIRALAEADEEILLKLWEGLGYYNRVRNMQKAARQVMEEYGGVMPDTAEELLKLKGIGSYTAGAIASIAFGQAVPAVDGNVLRVAARIRQDERSISDPKVKAAVERELKRVIPEERPGDFNQAMMELGACVCIPNGAPRCEECPLAGICLSHMTGRETEYPKKAEPKPRTVENRTILVIRDENRTVIRRRKGKGLLAGMYEFPTLSGFCTEEEVVEYLAGNGLKTIRIRPLQEAVHIFTHREWHMTGYMIRVDELEPKAYREGTKDWLYIEPEEAGRRYPIPKAFAAYMKYLSIRLGNERFKEEEA